MSDDKIQLPTDHTDNNLETCYCIGPQVVDGVKQSMCPCAMREVVRQGRYGVLYSQTSLNNPACWTLSLKKIR